MSEKHQVPINHGTQYALTHPAHQDDAAKDVESQRLFAEREAFSRLAKALSDAGSPQQIMNMALDYLVEQLAVHAGLLYLLPSDADGVVASHGLGDQVQGRLATFLGWWTSRIGAISDRPLVVTHPMLTSKASLLGPQSKPTSLMLAGISASGRLIGLAAFEREVDAHGPFSPGEVVQLDGILRHVALALENVRLRAFDISAFRELSLFPADARTIEEICERILDRIKMLFPSQACCMATLDRATDSLEIRASLGMQGDDGCNLDSVASKQPEAGPAGRPAIASLGPEETLSHFPSAAAGTGATTAIAFMNAQESYVGALVLVLKPEQELTDSRRLLLASLASQAALVIRSADLFISSQEMVVQEERSRIAREIHDGVAQNLALLMIKMEIISRLASRDPARMNKELENVMSVLESSVHELRRSIYALRSPDLARLGLLPAIKRLTRDFSEQTNIDVSLILPSSLSLSPQCQSAVFSVVQERLDAVSRDGTATEVTLSLAADDGNLDVRVQDNGRHIRPSHDASPVPAWQARLTDRIRPFGGTVEVAAGPADTRVDIRIPIPIAQA